jgi:hypothetical protein
MHLKLMVSYGHSLSCIPNAVVQHTLMMLRTVLTKYGVPGTRVFTSPLRMCTAILKLLPASSSRFWVSAGSDNLWLCPEYKPACSRHIVSSSTQRIIVFYLSAVCDELGLCTDTAYSRQVVNGTAMCDTFQQHDWLNYGLRCGSGFKLHSASVEHH